MRLPRAPGPARPRRGPGRGRAAVLAVAVVVLAVLAVLAVAAAARPAPAAAPARPAAAVTLARATLAAEIVPAATAAPARPATPAAEAMSLPGTGGCGLLDFGCYVSNAITSWFAGLVKSAVNPLLALIGRTALSTPQPDSIAAVRTLWSTGLGIADACYGLLVLIGGIIVMSHETLQTSYSAKEIAPRIVIGFITANLSMVLMSKRDRPRQRPVRRVHRRRGEPAERRHLADDHAGQLGQLRRDLPDPARPGRGRPGPGARGGLRDPADGRGAAGRRRPGPARPLRPAADRLGRPLVVAGADRRPGHPGRPGPGDDRRRAGVLLPRLAARRHQQHPRADPDHLVPAVHPDAHPVLGRAPRPFPVRPVPAAPRRPVRRHRRRSCPASPRCCAPARPPRAARPARSGKSGSSGSKPKGSTP